MFDGPGSVESVNVEDGLADRKWRLRKHPRWAVLVALVLATPMLLVGSPPSAAQSGQEGRSILHAYIIVELDEASCSSTGWVPTCTPTRASHNQQVEVAYIVLADLPVWSDAGVMVKTAAVDWCPSHPGTCGLDVRSPGKDGWVQGGGKPVVIHAPSLGYTIDRASGAWSTPTSTGILEVQ